MGAVAGYPLKGVPAGLTGAGTGTRLEPGTVGWNILDDTTDFPLMVLKQDALDANIDLMATYCETHRVSLAPHGKTTMSPQLFERQLSAGAWAMTVANMWQCRVARSIGVRRILMANELVDPAAIRWVAQELDADPSFDFYCYVDSVRGVEVIEEVFDGAALPQLQVLVEFGYAGGRTGCRSHDEAMALADRVSSSPATVLRGLSGYEGLMKSRPEAPLLSDISGYLTQLQALATDMQNAHPLPSGEEFLVSAGGSGYFDQVVEVLGPAQFAFPVRTVLRSGCYVTHDSGMYESTSPLAGRSEDPDSAHLQAALELWATVLSRPEEDLAIVGFGKRDAPYDYQLPVPLQVRDRASGAMRPVPVEYQFFELNDQHAFLRVPPADHLQVGDQIVSGINHPCGAFEKWRVIPLVDRHYEVVDNIISLL